MQFNTGQMLELTGISREQLRHWRKVLPTLKGRDGRADLYSFDEILALGTIAVLTDSLGISISRLSRTAQDIFAMFSDVDDRPALLHFTPDGRVVTTITDSTCEAYATVMVSAVYQRIKSQLSADQQRQLLLPLSLRSMSP